LIVAVATLTACGDKKDFANKPRPPAPISISAVITDNGVAVDPPTFGAGPINITVSNQTDKTQKLTVETKGSGTGIKQSTAPINPQGAATLTVDLDTGSYTAGVGGGIKDAVITVTAERESSQDKLLLP
jgi:hypothetical protein